MSVLPPGVLTEAMEDAAALSGQQAVEAVGECFCDRAGLGVRGVSCGDCPRDYAQPPAPAVGEAIAPQRQWSEWAESRGLYPRPTPAVQTAAPGDMARALEWFRAIVQGSEDAADKPHIAAIEEAIAAYDPVRMAKCGNTVAAPGDVEGRARELLAAEYDKANLAGTALRIRANAPLPAGWQDECIAIRAISAALRSQGQADAVDDAMVARFIEAATKQGFLHLRGTAVERSAHNLLTATLAQQANKDQPPNTQVQP